MDSVINKAILTLDYLETQILEEDLNCVLDVERSGADTLQITYKEKTKVNTYLFNVRTSIAQIWLSSPISGPSHFFFENGFWKTSAGNELCTILNAELLQVLGIDFKIKFDTDLAQGLS
jgi:CyaY protein